MKCFDSRLDLINFQAEKMAALDRSVDSEIESESSEEIPSILAKVFVQTIYVSSNRHMKQLMDWLSNPH